MGHAQGRGQKVPTPAMTTLGFYPLVLLASACRALDRVVLVATSDLFVATAAPATSCGASALQCTVRGSSCDVSSRHSVTSSVEESPLVLTRHCILVQ